MNPVKFGRTVGAQLKTKTKYYYTVWSYSKQPTERWKHTTGKTHAKTVEMIAERKRAHGYFVFNRLYVVCYSIADSLCTFALFHSGIYSMVCLYTYIHRCIHAYTESIVAR